MWKRVLTGLSSLPFIALCTGILMGHLIEVHPFHRHDPYAILLCDGQTVSQHDAQVMVYDKCASQWEEFESREGCETALASVSLALSFGKRMEPPWVYGDIQVVCTKTSKFVGAPSPTHVPDNQT